MKKYLVQRMSDGEQFSSLMTESEVVDYINMADCHNESFVVYDISDFGTVKKLKYIGWQSGCLIQLTDDEGNVIISGYGEDH